MAESNAAVNTNGSKLVSEGSASDSSHDVDPPRTNATVTVKNELPEESRPPAVASAAEIIDIVSSSEDEGDDGDDEVEVVSGTSPSANKKPKAKDATNDANNNNNGMNFNNPNAILQFTRHSKRVLDKMKTSGKRMCVGLGISETNDPGDDNEKMDGNESGGRGSGGGSAASRFSEVSDAARKNFADYNSKNKSAENDSDSDDYDLVFLPSSDDEEDHQGNNQDKPPEDKKPAAVPQVHEFSVKQNNAVEAMEIIEPNRNDDASPVINAERDDDDDSLFSYKSQDSNQENGGNNNDNAPVANDASDGESLFLSGSDNNNNPDSDTNESLFADDDAAEENPEVNSEAGESGDDSLFGDVSEGDRDSHGGVGDDGENSEFLPPDGMSMEEYLEAVKPKSKPKGGRAKHPSIRKEEEKCRPLVRVQEEDDYYFMDQFGERMVVLKSLLRNGMPKKEYIENGRRYLIVYSELVQRDSKGFTEDGLGKKYYKSYYFAVSGPGIPEMDLSSTLLSIADFEKLTLEDGPHKALARLKLMFSCSCFAPESNKYHLMFPDFDADKFEIIEDNGHLGCGFIPCKMLINMLGNSVRAQKMCAVQVRIFGPTRIGIAKGMLVAKKGIEKIQLPRSMIKADPCNQHTRTPLHDGVAIIIIGTFPSASCEKVGKVLAGTATKSQRADLKEPGDTALMVLRSKGVPEEILQEYIAGVKEGSIYNHCNPVGVADPTSKIPEGLVFVTGMGPTFTSKVFLTAYPCTEAKDGLVTRQASVHDIGDLEAFKYLNSMAVGQVIFPLGSNPLPPKMNNADLDGDVFLALWDENVVRSIRPSTHTDEDTRVEVLKDSLINVEFLYERNGVEYNALVVQKKQENPDVYLVDLFDRHKKPTKPALKVEFTRDEIVQGRLLIRAVTSHRVNRGRTQLKLHWEDGSEEWKGMPDLRSQFSEPPSAIVDYAFDHDLIKNKDCKWMKKYYQEYYTATLVEIVGHREVEGKMEVLCRYDNDDEDWQPLDEIESGDKEDKLLVRKYVLKENLENDPKWLHTSSYWINAVWDLLCVERRANEIKSLTMKLYQMYRNRVNSDDFGPFHEETILWGRAYKQSLEIEKHGNKVDLPLYLYHDLTQEKHKRYINITGV